MPPKRDPYSLLPLTPTMFHVLVARRLQIRPSPTMSREDRIFKGLLRLFPAEFRGDFGDGERW